MAMTLRLMGTLFGGVLAYCSVPAQTIYKSIGPNGVPVYSDHPPASGKIEKTYEFVELPSSPLPAAQALPSSPALRPNAASHRAVPSMAGVVLFATSWCGYCKRARSYLAKKGIGYQEINVETPDGGRAFAQAGGAGGGVPLLALGNRRVRGFTPAGYDAFFSSR